MRSEDVLRYWFGHIPGRRLTARGTCQILARLPMWGGNWGRRVWDVDRDIRERFGATLAQAATGAYDHWTGEPTGRLALIVLLDQFSRNIYRGKPEAFQFDSKTLEIAKEGLARGEDRLFYPAARSFFYLVLEHQEDLVCQDRAMAYYRNALRRTGCVQRMILLAEITSAARHRQMIRRFGRFPHRNRILGRESTPEEERMLRQPFTQF